MEPSIERKIGEFVAAARAAIAAADRANIAALPRATDEINLRFTGKNGELNNVYRLMKDLKPDERPAFGKLVNEAKEEIEGLVRSFNEEVSELLLRHKLAAERIDVTLPAAGRGRGAPHPLTLIRDELVDFFTCLGFEVADGPEIETDYYNFRALNVPADHPARDAQDTFYITDNLLLRTQTSAAQIRTMERRKPPIKMICPGRVYRADGADATHSPVFHQLEGLVVDKGIDMRDLKGVLDALARRLFGKKAKTRLRPSFFPFTEPSVEVDASCATCGGAGCSACKNAGWVEILGAGMVHRAVLSGCGIDPDKYSGFAFGIGIDRIACLKFKIGDMRYLFENDVRFLRQFSKGGVV